MTTRIGIVNDVALVAEALRRIVVATPDCTVAWIAKDGVEAVRMARTDTPDVILMDLVMPVMDGVEATRRIMRESPCAILVVTATVTGNLTMVFEALGHGALDAVQTPGFRRDGDDDGTAEFRRKLATVARLVAAPARPVRPGSAPRPDRAAGKAPTAVTPSQVRSTPASVSAARAATAPGARAPQATAAVPAAARSGAMPPAGVRRPGAGGTASTPSPAAGITLPLVLIGASTGGPQAVADLLAGLSPGLPAGVVVVQHLDARFAPSFVEWLGRHSPLPVVAASRGDRPRPGVVAVAIGEEHLRLDPLGAFTFTREPENVSIRPSADVLFESVASRAGSNGVAVILTGMGRDGARGMLALRRKGFHTLAQDAETSVIHGMPSAAAAAGAVMEMLPIDRIGPRVMELLRGRPR